VRSIVPIVPIVPVRWGPDRNKSAWRLDGHHPLTTDEVIDHLVDMFYRISDIAPPPPQDNGPD
jgi:hypothetical protein